VNPPTISSSQQGVSGSAHRVKKDTVRSKESSKVLESRLERLESLLKKAIENASPAVTSNRTREHSHEDSTSHGSRASSQTRSSNSAAAPRPTGYGLASNDSDGLLLLEDGHARFVSSLHWSLLADEIHDIKALVRDTTFESDGSPRSQEQRRAMFMSKSHLDPSIFAPETLDEIQMLLDTFFENVNPVCMLVHEPTLRRRFSKEHAEKLSPLSFAIYYSAVFSLRPSDVLRLLGRSKDALLQQFEEGLEVALHREDYLRTTQFEVLQAFVIWMVG